MTQIPFGRPMLGDEEKQAVLEVLSGPILVHGPRAKEFEAGFAAFTGAARAVAVSSCTAGMHLVWMALGLGPGDEVLVSAQTHAATAHAVEYTGARAVFVDAELDTGNLDLDLLEGLVTERTRGIALVHYLGLPVDMDRVMALAEKRGLFVLEDCALAVGTSFRGRHAGTLGHAGAFSFYPVKHMTTAEGGMLTTGDQGLADDLARRRAFGVDRVVGERKAPGVYDVNMLGYNYRMNELSAALGRVQLARVPDFLARRAANTAVLRRALAGMPEVSLFHPGDSDRQSSNYCLSVMLHDPLAAKRFEVVSALGRQGVGTSVYYPRPVPLLAYYAEKYGYRAEDFPNALAISSRSIALPVGPHLNEDHMRTMADALKAAIQEVK